MSEFQSRDPLDCFKPVWSDRENCWKFDHLLSGRRYDYMALVYFRLCSNMKMLYLYDQYRQNALQAAHYHMDPVFFLHWVRQMRVLDAINYAEDARLEYLVENPKKGKQSEAVYAKAYDEFMDKYRREM